MEGVYDVVRNTKASLYVVALGVLLCGRSFELQFTQVLSYSLSIVYTMGGKLGCSQNTYIQ